VESGSSSRVAGPLDYRSRRDASDRFGRVRIAQRVPRADLCKLMSLHQHNTCCVLPKTCYSLVNEGRLEGNGG
jgi:hypothetical protein